MNLDQDDINPAKTEEKTPKKKLTRKEKKALKKAEKKAATPSKPAKAPATAKPSSAQTKVTKEAPPPPVPKPEEVEVKLDPAPVPDIPPPKYTAWEKISPPARRKKQITTMESGFREVLALVHSMRNNQEVLLDAFQKLPEAVDSVKKLADHSARQSDLLEAMTENMGGSAAGEFNKTMKSMDQTTQLLLERAQRSEERLYGMLRRAQRRITFMTLMVLLLFLGAVAAVIYVAFPEKAQQILGTGTRENSQVPIEKVQPTPAPETIEETPADPVNEVIPEFPAESATSPIDQPEETLLPMEETEVLPEEPSETVLETEDVQMINPIPLQDIPVIPGPETETEETLPPVIEPEEMKAEVVLPEEASEAQETIEKTEETAENEFPEVETPATPTETKEF